jgi:hypothetical protein
VLEGPTDLTEGTVVPLPIADDWVVLDDEDPIRSGFTRATLCDIPQDGSGIAVPGGTSRVHAWIDSVRDLSVLRGAR